jgi:molybdopterin-guanine dinucleotide biosynthesis protein A
MGTRTAVPVEVGGYILAGGKSSRMGADKALLQLAGKPLIQHAVTKVRRTCAEVHILGNNPALAAFAPLVPDVHPNCGPIGGMEAALMHSSHDWNLFLAVDMPFLPTAYISGWVYAWPTAFGDFGPGIRMFTANGGPQPGFCLMHKDVLPYLSLAIRRGEFKVMQVFEEVGRELPSGLWNTPAPGLETRSIKGYPRSRSWEALTEAQQAASHLWFANLNTPEDFALAEAHGDALDT